MPEDRPGSGGTTVTNGSSNLEIAQSNQDLIISKGKRKKRTWIIVGVICAIVVGLVIAAIILINNGTDPHENSEQVSKPEALSLEDFLYGKFNPTSFNGTWASGNELLYQNNKGDLLLYNLDDQSSQILLQSNESILRTSFMYELSADKQYLLLGHDAQKLYRYSFRAQYTIIKISTNEQIELKAPNDQTLLQLVVWSPTGNALAYVFNNNIYYKSSVEDSNSVVITNTSPSEFVTNGVPDWVYEEEVFSSNKALWFSPDGRKLAFGRFNDTFTQIMYIPIYGEPGKLEYQYPRGNLIKYPKAGTRNPTVSLHVVDLVNTSANVILEPPSNLENKDPILTAVEWATNDVVAAIWMNRVQNEASIITYTASEPYSTQIVNNINYAVGWIELYTPPMFSKDGSEMVVILSQDQGGNKGSYRHITLLKREDNAKQVAVTSGTYVVTEILGWNHDNNLIYYTANTPNSSSVQHLYSVSPETKEISCLSCSMRSKYVESIQCLYNTVDFSKDFSHYALTCAGPDVPQVSLFSVSGNNKIEWETNEALSSLVRRKTVPAIKKLEFDISDGFQAKVMLKLPPEMDTSGDTKYPMVVNVYGGPDTYQVVDKFSLDWGSYLAANKSIIYATIDGRGSGLRGDKIMFAGYRRLGTVEVIDQVNVTKLIHQSLPYVDSTRTAIWGWSYGGYASGMALATDNDGIFKCGISVAPVTDWALYDSIYTERFMGLPTVNDNLEGYENAQLLQRYAGIKDKEYFLIHGTYDDNVHYQQSMLWAKQLELHDILFRQLSYPDEDHGLGSVRPHLYHSLENFLDTCFDTTE